MTLSQRREYVAYLWTLDAKERDAELTKQRNARDLDRANMVGVVISLRRSMGVSLIKPVLEVGRRAEGAILRALTDSAPNVRVVLTSALRKANRDMMLASELATLKQSDEIQALHVDTYEAVLTPQQKFVATGLPLDAFGNVKPPVDEIPGVIDDDGFSFGDVLEFASPLLAVSGLKLLSPAMSAVFGGADSDSLLRGSARSERMRAAIIPIRRAATRILEAWRRDDGSVGKEIDKVFGFKTGRPGRGRIGSESIDTGVGGSGVARLLQNNQRSDGRRMYEQSLDRGRQKSALFIGYELLSVFDEHTRFLHANNSGKRFFKDNRKGSAAPWEERIVPPYPGEGNDPGHTCLCFTRDEMHADGEDQFVVWQATDNPELEPRDPRVWQQWFSDQRESVQRRLVGNSRYNATSARNSRVAYEHVVRVDGRFMSARAIANESADDRRERIATVRQLINRNARIHRKALADGGELFNMSDSSKAKHRRRIAVIAGERVR